MISGEVFFWEGLSIKVYEDGASEIIPALTQIVWRQEKKNIARVNPHGVRPKFLYRLSPQNYGWAAGKSRGRYSAVLEPWTWRWRTDTQRATLGAAATVVVSLVRVLPKVGPLHALKFSPPTFPVQDMFISSFDVTVARYESLLSELLSGARPVLANSNLDTGRPGQAGSYWLADRTYEDLLNKLAEQRFGSVSRELRRNILAYFGDLDASFSTTSPLEKWQRQLAALREVQMQGASLIR